MTLFKVAMGAALGVMGLSVAGLNGVVPYQFSVWLLFALPLLWTLWLVYAISDARGPAWRTVILWVAFDVDVLSVLTLTTMIASGTSAPSGGDVAVVIAYSPIILPLILVSSLLPAVGNGLMLIVHGSSVLIPDILPMHVRDWFGGSLLAGIVSALYASLIRGSKRRTKEEGK